MSPPATATLWNIMLGVESLGNGERHTVKTLASGLLIQGVERVFLPNCVATEQKM
jgi:hypothetical protein